MTKGKRLVLTCGECGAKSYSDGEGPELIKAQSSDFVCEGECFDQYCRDLTPHHQVDLGDYEERGEPA